MRYVGMVLFLTAIPLLVACIRSSIEVRRSCWILMGASPFIYVWGHLFVALVSWAYWPGHVKGMIIALPDLLAVALIIASKSRAPNYSTALAVFFYLVCCSVSLFFASAPMASFFWLWQLARVILVLTAVARMTENRDAPSYLISGMCYGILFQTCFAVYQRVHGVNQVTGTMGHQNLLGIMTHFGFLMIVGLILSGDRRLILKIGAVSAVLVIVLSGSRGALGFSVAGAIALLVTSLIRRPTPRKSAVAAWSVLGVLIATPIALGTLHTRFASADSQSYDERAAFERAAKAMWRDHPMGVGANEYVVIANTKGYSKQAGVAIFSGSLSAHVHNVYLLVAAETGYLGLCGFLVLFAVAIYQGMRSGWRRPFFKYSDLALSAGFALLAVALHNFFEWVFVSESTQYLFAITLGLISGLTSQHTLRVRETRLARRTARQQATNKQVQDAHGHAQFA